MAREARSNRHLRHGRAVDQTRNYCTAFQVDHGRGRDALFEDFGVRANCCDPAVMDSDRLPNGELLVDRDDLAIV